MKSSELLRLLRRAGWKPVGQEGSHIKLIHPNKPNIIISQIMDQGKLVQVWRRKFGSKQVYEKIKSNY